MRIGGHGLAVGNLFGSNAVNMAARARRLEPDAILLLLAYAGALIAVWSVRP